MSEQHFSTTGPVRLEVRLASGEVRVTTVDRSEATVVLDGPPKLLEALRVELIGDRLIVEERRKGFAVLGFGNHSHTVDARIQLPHASAIDVATASADVRLDGQFAAVDVKSASGDLQTSGEISGDASFKTASGSARFARIAGKLNAKTVSGDVSADVVGRSASGKSVSGSFAIGSVSEGKVDLHSVSGDVVLGVASGTNIDVDAASVSGELNSEIPLGADAGARGARPRAGNPRADRKRRRTGAPRRLAVPAGERSLPERRRRVRSVPLGTPAPEDL